MTEGSAMQGNTKDLSEYGLNYTIVLPDDQSTQTDIMANDWGGIEIMKGENFMLQIAFGEGDIELLKSDLNSDLVYKTEILEESPDLILYKREIPNTEMDPEYHFMYVHREGSDAIEIQNIKAATFNEEMIRKMLQSAKSFKALEQAGA